MLTRQEIKEKSKSQLRGKWSGPICVMLIWTGFSFILGLLSNIPILGVLAQMLIMPVLLYSMFKYFLDFTRDRNPSPSYLFGNFSLWGKAFLVNFFIGLLVGLWGLLLAISIFLIVWIPNIITAALVVIGGWGAIVMMTIVQYHYRQVYFMMVDYPELSSLETLRKSKEMMDGHKMELFILDLSFIGWSLLCLLTCGIGYFFLGPYIFTTYANYYDGLKETTEPDVYTIDPQYQG